jgi:hypothetical protein
LQHFIHTGVMMPKLYHGTVTGKDDLFLESFIITGAMSSKSRDAWDQGPGFYVSMQPEVPQYRAITLPENNAKDQWEAWPKVHWGRGMIVALEAKIDAKNWDIDHEVSGGYSMTLIERMRDLLKPAAENAEGDIKTILETFYEATDKKQDFKVYVGIPALAFLDNRKTTIVYPQKREDEGTRGATYFMQVVHNALKENFPEAYQKEKQKVLDEMVVNKNGHFKYIGTAPLKISKIYLRPPETILPVPLEKWEVAYDAMPAINGPKPAGSSPATH